MTILRMPSESESESELYYDRRSVGQSVLVSSPLLGLMTRFFNTVRHLRVCWYGGPPLMRGQVCLLQLLLSSLAQSFWGPSPTGLMTTFYCLRFETPPTLRTRSLYLYPPGTRWPGYTPRHWVDCCWVSELYYDRRSVGQSVLVSSPPSGAYHQIFVTVRQLRVCWYGAPSLTRGWVCRLQLLLHSPAQLTLSTDLYSWGRLSTDRREITSL
jgi:hypothetical protein